MTIDFIKNLQEVIEATEKFISLQEPIQAIASSLGNLKDVSKDESSLNFAIKIFSLSQEKLTINIKVNNTSKNLLECLKSNTLSFSDPNNFINNPKSIEAKHIMTKCSTSMSSWEEAYKEYNNNELEQYTQSQDFQHEVQEFCKMSGEDIIVSMVCNNLV